ncbi:MAG: nuclear transport factor 2 family protein [Planctomycetota bacterium]
MARKVLVAVNLLLLVGVAALFLFRSEEDRLRSAVQRVAEVLRKTGDEPELAVVGRGRALDALLTPDCVARFSAPVPGALRGRKEIVGAFMHLWKGMPALHVHFRDITIERADDATAATVTLLAAADAGDRHEERAVRMEWVLQDGDWRIASAEELSRESNRPAP